jgi:ATP-dependent Clp protease ATP-binding subunit ClpB
VNAPELAKGSQQQIVETEHLMKSMLEQPNGLARRILSKAGVEPSRLLEQTDLYIKRQPRVSGDAGAILGRNLEGVVSKAQDYKVKQQLPIYVYVCACLCVQGFTCGCFRVHVVVL